MFREIAILLKRLFLYFERPGLSVGFVKAELWNASGGRGFLGKTQSTTACNESCLVMPRRRLQETETAVAAQPCQGCNL